MGDGANADHGTTDHGPRGLEMGEGRLMTEVEKERTNEDGRGVA